MTLFDAIIYTPGGELAYDPKMLNGTLQRLLIGTPVAIEHFDGKYDDTFASMSNMLRRDGINSCDLVRQQLTQVAAADIVGSIVSANVDQKSGKVTARLNVSGDHPRVVEFMRSLNGNPPEASLRSCICAGYDKDTKTALQIFPMETTLTQKGARDGCTVTPVPAEASAGAGVGAQPRDSQGRFALHTHASSVEQMKATDPTLYGLVSGRNVEEMDLEELRAHFKQITRDGLSRAERIKRQQEFESILKAIPHYPREKIPESAATLADAYGTNDSHGFLASLNQIMVASFEQNTRMQTDNSRLTNKRSGDYLEAPLAKRARYDDEDAITRNIQFALDNLS